MNQEYLNKEFVIKGLSKEEKIVYIKCLEQFKKGQYQEIRNLKELTQRSKIRQNSIKRL